MAQLLHGSATTTAGTWADIRASTEPAVALARRYGVNRKTVPLLAQQFWTAFPPP